ncbi:hypothetical protein BJ875DRAFT_267876 [Amylocarpus encephaloides]|uniref:MFS maltose permease n=1 Tax=Amylocarpus encephaloides TaxID=45428 RepID=A0A9P8C6E3_9HELO|nr:hypothetical protein BJ875DRAFT_267876 [Amylocarpus encephaloides]
MRPPFPIRRIQLLRPFRPPNTTRLFTRNTLPATRPSLQFLSPPHRRAVARYISTETRAWLKSEVKKGFKYTAIVYTFVGLGAIITFGVHCEWTERKYNPDREWSWLSRHYFRMMKMNGDEEMKENGIANWALVFQNARILIGRLENPDLDGAGLERQADGGIWVEGVGETGFNITSKSEPWRRCYHQALMDAAKGAEYMEDTVLDKKSKTIFPSNMVVGPSNPRPKPLPPGTQIPRPLEENCEKIFESPEVFYMRILTTHGFTQKQYVDAALHYGAWLDFKMTPETALEMYKWAMDIATSNSKEAKASVDPRTGVISSDKIPSENVLNVSTAMAVHHALNSNINIALPVFLSILRARRSLPTPDLPTNTDHPPQPTGIMPTIASFIRTLLVRPPYPDAPQDGTLPPPRTPQERCAEAGIMANVGEILYASKASQTSREDGLAWTREAVDIAEEQITRARLTKAETRTCKECLGVAVKNWDIMVSKLAKEERDLTKNGGGSVKVGGWMGFGSIDQPDAIGRWQSEELVVKERRRRASDLLDSGPPPPSSKSPASFFRV